MAKRKYPPVLYAKYDPDCDDVLPLVDGELERLMAIGESRQVAVYNLDRMVLAVNETRTVELTKATKAKDRRKSR